MAGVSTCTPADKGTTFWLSSYLIAVSLLTGYLFISLWSAQPRPTMSRAPVPTCAGIPNPKLTNLYPDEVGAGSAVDVIAIGCNLPSTSMLKVNGVSHSMEFWDANHIRVGFTAADVATAGTVTLVFSDAGKDYGAGKLRVVQSPANLAWIVFGTGPWFLTADVQLLLLVLVTGAFGASVYALKSLSDYRGENKLFTSWITFYIVQPLRGAGIALILYLVVRGGFLTTAGSDAKNVNQFGMCAIAALAGAFSDMAFMKLREVFLTLFKPQDDRAGKVAPLKITTASLPDGTVGASYNQTLQATGGAPPLPWSVSPALPPELSLDPKTGTISGTPIAALPKATFAFGVTDSSSPPNCITADLSLQITAVPGAALTITTTALPNGKVGKAYNQMLTVAGGTAPHSWAVSPNLPAGLTLDPGTGNIAGTPPAVSAKARHRFTVTDASGATAMADLYFGI